jgi:hypothetical protein
MVRRVKVRGVRKPLDQEQLAMAIYLQTKRVARERRERERKAQVERDGDKR